MSADIEARHPSARPDVEIYPGTEILEDVADSHLVHRQNNGAAVLLVPQPSHSPNDPLNWSPRWKWTVVVLQAYYILSSVISALSVSPLTPVFEAQFGKDAEAIALLTSTLVIVTGYANFVLVPIAEVYGRRFILILCQAIAVGATIWHGAAQSYGSFMGARVLLAIGMSLGESLTPMVIGDVFFLHERGRYIGIYFFCLFNGMFLGPLIAGSSDQNLHSWRDFYWIIAAFQGSSCLLIIFFHPETKYIRPAGAPSSLTTIQSVADCQDGEKAGKVEVETETEHVDASLPSSTRGSPAAAGVGIDMDEFLGRGKPAKNQFRLIQPGDRDAISKLSRHVITPFRLLGFPIIVFGSWMLASSASGLLSLNYIQSAALTVAPYNFDNGQVGLTNLALVGGGTIGMFTAGPFSDWVAMRLTKRNRGIREPEMRLWAMIPFLILSTISLVVVGVGLDHQWPWEAVIVIGFGGIGLMTVSVSTIGITYAVDSYKPVSGQIMVIGTVLKNSFGFGQGYYITKWVEKSGFTSLFMSELAITIGPAVIGIVFFSIYGKHLRKLTRNSEVHGY